MNKMTLKVIAGVLAVFLLGGIIGGLGAGIYLRQRVEQFTRKAPKDHKELFMERLSRALDLKESQKAEVEQIVTDSMTEVRELIQRSRVEFEQITERTATGRSPTGCGSTAACCDHGRSRPPSRRDSR